MRPLAELLSPDPAWPGLRTAISRSTRSVEILPTSRPRAEAVLLSMQVTTRSTMGAIALETGGLVIDRWLRVLGGGGPRMDGDLARWNGRGERPILERQRGLRLVGHDAIGGFFALDGGELGDGKGEVFYFAPDSLDWEGIDMGYSGWLESMLENAINDFYAENRWTGWEREVADLEPDSGLSIWPGLWTAESRPIEKTSRKAVPMAELWAIQQDFAKQMETKAGEQTEFDDEDDEDA
jgi:hypothetical protein